MLNLLDAKEIYDKVDTLRLERGWSIYELAKQAGVPPTTIYNWRDRLSSPTLALLESICSALEITVIDFLLNEDELMALTEEQREVMRLWMRLTSEQKKSIINLMKSI